MRKRRLVRGILAGAIIGLVEAAGLDRTPRAFRRPLRVVWIDDREPADPLARTGIWFLDPIGDPRPPRTDDRRTGYRRLHLRRLDPRRLLRIGN